MFDEEPDGDPHGECRAEIHRLTALRCDCDEESGRHAPTCVVMVREQNVAMAAEIARLTAELAAARAEVDCGQDGPCVKAPGCARHWQERNRELADELAAARAVPADVEAALDTWAQSEIFAAESEYEPRDSARADANRDILRATIARAISEATATTSTVGGLLATAPVARPISEWHEDHGDALWWRFPIEEPPYCGSPLDDNWPGYHTHWTPIVCPDDPSQRGPLPKGG